MISLKEISQLLNDFPNDKLDNLAVSIGDQHREGFSRLREELFALLDQINADIEEQIRKNTPRSLEVSAAQLEALQAELETFFRRYSKKRRCVSVLPYFLYLLPLAFGYVAGIYFVFHDGVYPVSQEVIKPEGAYHLVTGDTDLLALSDQYNNQFWQNFSRYYFGRREPNRFAQNKAIELKFLLKNKSSSASYLVSTVSAEVKRIEAKPFPWEKVIVTPDIRATSKKEIVIFEDTGIGPAMDFDCTGKTQSGMLLFTERAKFLYKDNLRLQFDEPVEQVGIALVDKKGRLRYPLFLQLQSKDQAKGTGNVFQAEDAWYETVETLERLQQLTTVSYKEELALTWQYHSLRQEAYQDTLRLTLPETQAYYVKVKNLRKEDPRQLLAEHSEGMRMDSQVNALQADQARELINVLQGKEPPVLKGIDLITKSIKLNMSNIEPNHATANIENVDTILNPSGYVILYLTLDSPENGSYQVRISVNGNEVKRINIDALIPESYTFNINDHASLQRFHAKTQ